MFGIRSLFRRLFPGKPPAVTIGFYGAIAEWFDAELVADLATLRPGWRFELIGSTFTGNVTRLEQLPNVTLLGEKPYRELPRLVAGWDCFVVPFKRTPLTEATNPMKVYEMLATGKPVVAVDLPELRPMARDGLLSIADDAAGFAAAIERELLSAGRIAGADAEDHEVARPERPAKGVLAPPAEGGPAAGANDMRRRRQAFAAANTWSHRGETVDRAIRSLFPPASIIIVTYNNLSLNRQCLESVFAATDWPNFEVIVVDNASSDRTPQWLARRAAEEPRLRVILNRENRGFAGGNNEGLEAARGEFLCLLNNDTVVTHGWLSTLIGHLRGMPEVGLVGPVSNMVGNEAMIPVGYRSIADMPRWAAAYCRDHDGETMEMRMLGFFCVLLRREAYEKIGPLDERFGLGYFEDDDYCRRALANGYRLRTARDAFVHHWHGSSFRLLDNTVREELLRVNQRAFETKWATKWVAPKPPSTARQPAIAHPHSTGFQPASEHTQDGCAAAEPTR